MKTVLQNGLLAAILAALTLHVFAQATGSVADSKAPAQKATLQKHNKHAPKRAPQRAHANKQATGEAASLQREEAGLNADAREDNRGRLTSASTHAQKQHGKAQFKTGQLTTRQAAHLKTKKTSLAGTAHNHHGPAIGKKAPAGKAQTGQEQEKNGDQIHLREHNARMF